jgi:serine/threonine protein kinase
MAPEALRDQGYREKFDIFSLGSVFFNLLSGHFMFNGDSVAQQLKLNKECDLSLLPMYLETISEPCFELLFRMIDPDPEKRPSATEALGHPWLKQDEEVI